MRNLNISVGEGLNVDANVFVKGILILNVKLGSNLRDCLVDCCVAWGGKGAVVHVDNGDYFASIEYAVVHTGLL